MKKLVFILSICTHFAVQAQNHFRVNEIMPEVMKENVTVHSMCSDTHESAYLIWVKDSVKPHYHQKHTELIYVISGRGNFYVGQEVYRLKEGDFVRIPEGSIHSFKTTSSEEVKVISIQTPEFKGKDRVWVEVQK